MTLFSIDSMFLWIAIDKDSFLFRFMAKETLISISHTSNCVLFHLNVYFCSDNE